MIAIIDYGVGNLFSLKSSLDFIGLEAEITNDRNRVEVAEKIILPGVGAFGDAMDKLRAGDMDQVVIAQARAGKPLLGICLGMQVLFEKSYEYGEHEGLGLLKGEILGLGEDIGETGLKVPHMGWNSLCFVRENPLLKYVEEGDFVYYVHSFYAKNNEENLVAYSDYGVRVTGLAAVENVYGTQFHPEKSGDVGLRILKAFGEL